MEQVEARRAECVALGTDASPAGNRRRTQLYCELELLKLRSAREQGDTEQQAKLEAAASELQKMLQLRPAHKRMGFAAKADTVLRSAATVLCLASMAVVFSLPLLVIQQLDKVVAEKWRVSATHRLSEFLKTRMAYVVMTIAGIHLTVEGLDVEQFKEPSVLMFSHSSNLDGLAMAASIPVPYKALVKTDLFLLPFFSWLALVFGGIPIDRKNRERAVGTLRAAAASSEHGEVLAISPEGTRSTTGHLRPFKKGPFYLVESVARKVIPVVIFGAYELSPPGVLYVAPGQVYVRYLPAIEVSEIRSMTKTQLSQTVRERMLKAMCDPPAQAGQPLTWSQRIDTIFASLSLICLHYIMFMKFRDIVVQHAARFMLLSVVFTLGLYVWQVHLVHLLKRKPGSSASSSASPMPSS